MARFPFRPGAGAKGINNPVYWNRLYLQESGRYSRADERLTARWLNINTNLNFFLCGWVKPLLMVSADLTAKEQNAVEDKLDTVFEYRDTIASSWDYTSQSNLNKYVTQIKWLFLIVFRLTIKYGLFDRGESPLIRYTYDSKDKEFVLLYASGTIERRYFMGRPALRVYDEIRRLYRQSVTMVNQDFGKDTSANAKPPGRSKRSKKKRPKK